ncbi:ParB/RepB/Spo0J family partition protein [Pelagibius sp. Alg239-R121]|uniref:ParB/RepB/Spo0J family partition protein n=1 Tax=Pelagibius sp. Alg239-R121 TaxID=2993448 RepID=UPI0024A71145|nr:ParB/RepB/Spo0J family partition protein [Pelagibius sp. Alg239-R121]
MTIEMIPLTKLRPSLDNPRKQFDEETIAGLAQSIKTDGLLQNLVAAKPEGRKRIYPIISGERRYRALSLLVENGDFPKDVSVPVEVRESLSDSDILRIAAVENIQREDLSPLEEADAIQTLAEHGECLDEIAAQTGLSERTIQRRLVLLGLSDATKAALSDKRISLSQAEALSLGSHSEQDGLLDQVIKGWYSAPSDIKGRLIGQAPSMAQAIFPKEDYKGSLTTDLFGEDETSYFDDADEFFRLQKTSAESLVAEYEQSHDWAEFIEGRFSSLEYREAGEGESGGVVVQLCPSGKVEIHDGLIRKSIDASVSRALNTKATYAKPVCEYFAMRKSATLQTELLSHRRKAKEIGVVTMMLQCAVHGCYDYLANSDGDDAYISAIEAEAAALLDLLGEDTHGQDAFNTLFGLGYSKAQAYECIQRLDDDGLDRLFAFFSLVRFGQEDCDRLDTNKESLFNRVAGDIGIDMRKHWVPDAWFLSRRTMTQLQAILRDSGLSRLFGNGNGYKKSELVPMMVRYFCKVRNMPSPQPDQLQARDWLPEAMQFPAIDPDAEPAQSEAEESADDLTEAA